MSDGHRVVYIYNYCVITMYRYFLCSLISMVIVKIMNLPKNTRIRSQSTYVFMYDAPKDEIASVLTFARAPRSFEIQNNKFPLQ